ncbi:MAG TPA: MaoC family dehydratase N-terminal domain-containing protein [Accumulibacter sp.]|nr:MaoC family dehydratase N-terminal domain-containing protein [Accumulibacter sp.]HMW16920.1 MaoC family dehydratase N-terminal domain-containing protein [Accumulibacter sp.]HMX21462.1 MaoC family dehydratase N-terminal domain-containing protein [Accumulibacter sp.]HMY06935.1 MaoC family dehydratase N-terminal domain-containing protein [Accumulibacter sp.]HNC18742.1 MaoC family dehydratase N-terminal domain-containing protein [Accumulibacter sp.]
MLIDKKHIGMKVPPHRVHLTAWQLKWFAKAIGETNPVYFDEDAAHKAGLPGVLAPPTFLFCMDMDKEHPFDYLETMGCDLGKMLHGEQSFNYYQPFYSGDTLDFDGQITDIYDKKNGALQFVVKEVKVWRQGELVGDLRSVMVIRA